jgi:GNAT superfamily N-acetyltransferase
MNMLRTDFKIAPVDDSDLDAITALYTTYLNDGEPITRHLREAITNPGYIGVKCMDGDTIAGVLTAVPGIDFTYPHPELERRIKKRWGTTRLYSMDMILVQPCYQGQGVARTLAGCLRRRLSEAGVGILVVELWNPPENADHPDNGIVKYLGDCLEMWDCPDFYKELYERGMTCPECGDGPCRCGARIGILALNGSGGNG